MKAIILAAGRGSRMKKLTNEIPKCLIKLDGKTLLDRQIESLKAAGIIEIGIVTGYRRELLINRGLTEFHNARWFETNMVYSLFCVDEWLNSEPCIVCYSDLFYEPMGVFSLIENSSDLAITYDPNWLELWTSRFGDPLVDAETFLIDENSFITEIGNRPDSLDQVNGQYMGLLRFTPSGWQEVVSFLNTLTTKEFDHIHMTGTLQMLIQTKKTKIKAIPYHGEWGEFDSLKDLETFSSE